MKSRGPAVLAEDSCGTIEICVQWVRPIQMFAMSVSREGFSVEDVKQIVARRLEIDEELVQDLQIRRIARPSVAVNYVFPL